MADKKYAIYCFDDGLLQRIDEGTYDWYYSCTLDPILTKADTNNMYVSAAGFTLPIEETSLFKNKNYLKYTLGTYYNATVVNSKTGETYNPQQIYAGGVAHDKRSFLVYAHRTNDDGGYVGDRIVSEGENGSHGKYHKGPKGDGTDDTLEILPNHFLDEDGLSTFPVALVFEMQYVDKDGVSRTHPGDRHLYQFKQGYTIVRSNYVWNMQVNDGQFQATRYAEVEGGDDVENMTGYIPYNAPSFSDGTVRIQIVGESKCLQDRKWDDDFVEPVVTADKAQYVKIDGVSVRDKNGLLQATKDTTGTSFYCDIAKVTGEQDVYIIPYMGEPGKAGYKEKEFCVKQYGFAFGISNVRVTSSTLIPVTGGDIEYITFSYNCNGQEITDDKYSITKIHRDSKHTTYSANDTLEDTVSITISHTDKYGTYDYAISVDIYQEANTRERKNRADYAMALTPTNNLSAGGGDISYLYNAYHHEYWHYRTNEDSEDETVYDACHVVIQKNSRFTVDTSSVTDKSAGSQAAKVYVTHDTMGTQVGSNGSATDTITFSFYHHGKSQSEVFGEPKEFSVSNYQTRVYLIPTFTLGSVASVKPDGKSVSSKPSYDNVSQKYKHAYMSGAEEPNGQTYDVEGDWFDVYYSKDNKTWSKEHTGFTSNSTQEELTKEIDSRKLGTLYVKVKSLNGSELVGDYQLESEVKSVDVYQQANKIESYTYGSLTITSFEYARIPAAGNSGNPCTPDISYTQSKSAVYTSGGSKVVGSEDSGATLAFTSTGSGATVNAQTGDVTCQSANTSTSVKDLITVTVTATLHAKRDTASYTVQQEGRVAYTYSWTFNPVQNSSGGYLGLSGSVWTDQNITSDRTVYIYKGDGSTVLKQVTGEHSSDNGGTTFTFAATGLGGTEKVLYVKLGTYSDSYTEVESDM